MDDIVATAASVEDEGQSKETLPPTSSCVFTFEHRGVSASLCASCSASPQKNRRCHEVQCTSPYRVCRACIPQGASNAVAKPGRALCSFHEKHGERAHEKRAGELYDTARIPRSIFLSGAGKGGEELTEDTGIAPAEGVPVKQRGKSVTHRGTTTVRRLQPGAVAPVRAIRAPDPQPTRSFEPVRTTPLVSQPAVHTPQPMSAPVVQAPPTIPPEPEPAKADEVVLPAAPCVAVREEEVSPPQPNEAQAQADPPAVVSTDAGGLTAEEVRLKGEVTAPVWRLYRQGRINRTALQRIARYDKPLQYSLARDVANGVRLASKL